jgi:Protein of unknown function (DUF935)
MPDSKPSWFRRTFNIGMQTDDPRRRHTGVSGEAKGSIPTAGVVSGEKGSSRGGIIRDVVPALGNRQQQANIWDEMANGDASVDVSLRAAKMPIMGATYFVEPFADNDVDVEIAEFVEFNLLTGMGAPFLMVLEDILRMYEFGFSILESVWEDREWGPKRTGANRRTYTMIRKLAPRPTPTVKEIQYDNNGGPTKIIQSAVQSDGKPVDKDIDIKNLLIFTNNRKGGNLEGKSLLRTSYRPWYFKNQLYNIDGIQKERHGMGFPIVQPPPGYKDSDRIAGLEMVQNIRTNEFGGAFVPPAWVVRFLELPGQPVDVMRSIEHHNGTILLNTMSQFLLLGLEGTGGGRATSGSHQDMFNKSQRYVADLICDTINLYLIPYLVGYNFPTDHFPKLRARNLGETKDLQQWAAAISNLIAQNAITPDIETEQWVRTIVDAPFKRGGKQTPINEGTQDNRGNTKGDVEGERGGNAGADPTNAEG